MHPTQSWFNRLTLFFSLCLVVSTALLSYHSCSQGQIMQGQLEQMKVSSTQTTEIKDALNRVATSMDDSVSQSREALNQTIEVARSEQRAWVGAECCKGDLEVGKPFDVSVYLKNSGRSPAIEFRAWATAEPKKAGEKPTFTRFATRTPSRGILVPNAVYKIDVNPAKGKDMGEVPVQAIKTGKIKIYIYGRANYKDIFGRPHWVTFCSYFTTDGKYIVCDTHNETD